MPITERTCRFCGRSYAPMRGLYAGYCSIVCGQADKTDDFAGAPASFLTLLQKRLHKSNIERLEYVAHLHDNPEVRERAKRTLENLQR